MMLASRIDQEIKELLSGSQSILVVSHKRPDGDAIGSLLAIGHALIQQGKQVQLVLEDGLPRKYYHLASADRVKQSIENDYELCVVVDSSDLERTGSLLLDMPVPDIVIDHHKTNTHFGKVNLVEDEAVATASILALHMPLWGLSLDKDVSSSLLTGILGDTIGFRTSNVDSQTMRLVADLMDNGANLPDLYQKALVGRTIEEIRYWGQGLLKIVKENNLVWTSLSLGDRIKSGYFENDDADLINILSSTADAKIAMIFVEQDGGIVKVSWRSNSGIDVSGIAFNFGGGGHEAAAGAEIQGELSQVSREVIKETKSLLMN